jgi:hypothetical protein
VEKRACLLALPAGPEPGPEAILEAASASGLDSRRLGIQLRGRALTAICRGSLADVALAGSRLSAAGLSSAVVTPEEVAALPRTQSASGVAAEGEAVSLRAHGRPAGPPESLPLLFVFADLGRDDVAPGSAQARPGDSMRQRLLRAVFPVVDIAWEGGRLRVPVKGMAWRGLPGLGMSAPGNLLRLLELLAQRAAGTIVDVGFVGQDLSIDAPAAVEAIEGADRDRTAAFDRYSAAASLAWSKGLYPRVGPGEVAEVGAGASSADLARFVKAQTFFARPATALASRAASPVPWVRRGPAARMRGRVWPWLALGPVVLLAVPHRLSAVGLALAGAAGIGLAIRAASLREKLRSVPVSKVRSMAMGLVQVSGRTEATALLKAPYSHLECVWYCFDVKDLESAGEQRETWRTVAHGSSSDMPFRVEDLTGSVLVQPSDAEIDVEPATISLDENTLVREWILPAGIPVFVTGFAQRRSTDPGGSAPRDGDAPGDEVFIGASPGIPFSIATGSGREQQAGLRREFVVGVIAGGVYLVAALILWLALTP